MYPASPSRLARARREGKAPVASLTASTGMFVGFAIGISAASPVIGASVIHAARLLFGNAHEGLGLHGAGAPLQTLVGACIGVILAVVAGGVLAGWVASGWMVSATAVSVRSERVGARWGRLGDGALRALILGTVGACVLFALCTARVKGWAWMMPEATGQSAAWLGARLAIEAMSVVRDAAVTLAALGLADLLWARWEYLRSLRMTRGEVASESREQGGRRARGVPGGVGQQAAQESAEAIMSRASVLVMGSGERAVATALGYTPGVDAAPRVLGSAVGWGAVRMHALVDPQRTVVVADRVLAGRLAGRGAGEYIDAAAYGAVAAAMRRALR
jgi:flagellar biosynthetic protein FlhB